MVEPVDEQIISSVARILRERGYAATAKAMSAALTARIADLESQAAKLERIVLWCRPRLSRYEYRDALDRYLKEPPTEPDTTPIVQSASTAPAWVPTHRWQPIETAPKDGTEIVTLGWERGLPVHTVCAWDALEDENGWSTECGTEPIGFSPTHWMPLPDAPLPSAAAQEAADPPWITWEGGRCPIAPGTRGRIRVRDGAEADIPSNPNFLRWSNKGWPDDIVAYRIVRAQEGGHGG